MEYNFKKIGSRIKDKRKEMKMSQQDLIDAVSDSVALSRNTLSAIENGNANHFELAFLTALCKIFDCEMGYLLCEYDDCPTRDSQFIHDTIGLSQDSILSLQQFLNESVPLRNAIFEFLDDLIDNFFTLPVAIAYKQFKSGTYSGKYYHIADNQGKFIDTIDGDVSLLILQNAFTNFISSSSYGGYDEIISRAARRKNWNNLTDEARTEFREEAALNLLRGK